MKKNLLIIILLSVFFSCTREKQGEFSDILLQFPTYDKFIVIPYNSCLYCVEEAESFLKDQIQSEFRDVMFLLYDYPSKKEIYIKFGSLSNLDNFKHLSVEESFSLEFKYSTYIEFSNNEVVNIVYLDGENNPFELFNIPR